MTSKTSNISTRVEDEKDEKSSIAEQSSVSSLKPKTISISEIAETPEDVALLKNFDLEEAWTSLLQMPECLKVILTDQQQEDLGVQVGINVTAEFPWKQIKFRVLRDNFLDDIDDNEPNKETLQAFPADDLILIGYAPSISQIGEDHFVIYSTHDSAKRASAIIKSIEAYNRLMLNHTIMKKGREWKTRGSEKEVDRGVRLKRKTLVDVEIQSVYPIKDFREKFHHRYTKDVRDGYVELIPGDKRFENIFRKRIDACVQSAPSMVCLEQQTDPTFPSNAWSQYLYEINPDDEELDVSDAEKDEKEEIKRPPKASSARSSPTPEPLPPPPPPPPEMSKQVKKLLSTLEFNKIDMYRNDYPLIAEEDVPKYTQPYLKEIMCFSNIEKCHLRYVSAVAWYPTISSLFVLSYSFSTIATPMLTRTNEVKRTVLEANPILMWTFDDNLHPKMEFESPREVTALSFCPYNSNILIGGTINGQVIIWDLQNLVDKCDYVEVLTTTQTRYRLMIRQYLEGIKMPKSSMTVEPTALSSLTSSHLGPIVSIKWLSRYHYITRSGQTREESQPKHRFFLTNGMDGTVAFWSLDQPVDKKALQPMSGGRLPKQLQQDISDYKKFDRVFAPQYVLVHPQPLSGIITELGKFSYKTEYIPKILPNTSLRIPMKVTELQPKEFSQNLMCATMLGKIQRVEWEGFDVSHSEEINTENFQITKEYGHVHDGPILEIRRNLFIRHLFASIGKNILAIWSADFIDSPLFWRRRPASLTALRWSLDRPSVLFLTRSDGTFEVWDILARTDDAALIDMLGGSILTFVSEHRPSIPKKVLGVGDYNSNFRLLLLPMQFQLKVKDEEQVLRNYIIKECTRKLELQSWEKMWRQKNKDVMEARKEAEEQSRADLLDLQKQADVPEEGEESRQPEDKKRKEKDKEKDGGKKKGFDLPERLEKKWDEMNLRYLMSVLMARKMVDPVKLAKKTVLEKDKMNYEQDKKTAIKESFARIEEEAAAVRARLLPTFEESFEFDPMLLHLRKTFIGESESYESIERDILRFMKENPLADSFTYNELLQRGEERRHIINRSLGLNVERNDFYQQMKAKKKLDDMDFGYKTLLNIRVTEKELKLTTKGYDDEEDEDNEQDDPVKDDD